MMGRITRWGADQRGRQVTPLPLVRRAQPWIPPLPEAIEDLPVAPIDVAPAKPGFLETYEDLGEPIGLGDDRGDLGEDLELDEPLTERDRHTRPPRDLTRFIAAMRRKAVPVPMAPRVLEPATSPEECRRCGIPGRKGCDHQAPFVPDYIAPRLVGASGARPPGGKWRC